MYGQDFSSALPMISNKDHDLLIIIGGEKVPPEYYQLADYNLAVGNQPHSEVAALALLLDRIFQGKEFSTPLSGGMLEILPQERGKKIVPKTKEKPFKRAL